MSAGGEMSDRPTSSTALIMENAALRAEIERLRADNHKLMLWNEQLQAELDIARRALEGK